MRALARFIGYGFDPVEGLPVQDDPQAVIFQIHQVQVEVEIGRMNQPVLQDGINLAGDGFANRPGWFFKDPSGSPEGAGEDIFWRRVREV